MKHAKYLKFIIFDSIHHHGHKSMIYSLSWLKHAGACARACFFEIKRRKGDKNEIICNRTNHGRTRSSINDS